MPNPNLYILEEAATKLAPLLNQVVFVGGAVLGLLITDSGAAPIRPTTDIDVVAEISTPMEYYDFSEQLRVLGFTEDNQPESPTCRWLHGQLILDVMPTEAGALGFTNRWYRDVVKTADKTFLPTGRAIQLINPPYFLGTKIEAFRTRGNGDYFSSHDLEDFVAVIDGRQSVLEEIRSTEMDLRDELADAVRELLAQNRFIDALPGYMLPDDSSQLRLPRLLATLKAISEC